MTDLMNESAAFYVLPIRIAPKLPEFNTIDERSSSLPVYARVNGYDFSKSILDLYFRFKEKKEKEQRG